MVFERAEGPRFQIKIAFIINTSMTSLCPGWRSRRQASVSAATVGVSIGVGEAAQSMAGKKAGICFGYPETKKLLGMTDHTYQGNDGSSDSFCLFAFPFASLQ